LAIVQRAADPAPHAEAFHRLALAQFIAGDVAQARSLFDHVFDRLLSAGARINEPEALTYRALLLFHLGDLAAADVVATRNLAISEQRSPHSESHGLATRALVEFGRGEWASLARTAARHGDLAARHAGATWCILGAGGTWPGAAADPLAR